MTARFFPSVSDPVALVASVALFALAAAILGSDSGPARNRPPPAAANVLPSDEILLRSFALVALEREHEAEADPGIAKWQAPIRVRLFGLAATDAATGSFLWNHLRRLAALSGLTIRHAAPGEPANYRIIFTARRHFADRVRASLDPGTEAVAVRLVRANCVGMFHQDVRTQAIVRATVIIPVDHARARGLLRRCIVEETTQVLGLPNDAALPVASVFNDTSTADALSAHDALLLKLLYHPTIRTGMKRHAALAAARRALPSVRQRFLAGQSGH
ncbi:MAG: DUF2927 domain-containing protein [Bauldia litoralis]